MAINLPEGADLSRVPDAVEACSAAEGLHVTLTSTLARYPGCVHWHLKRGRERGTLEVTWWPRERRLWTSIQASRTAPWVEESAQRLRHGVEATLRSMQEGEVQEP